LPAFIPAFDRPVDELDDVETVALAVELPNESPQQEHAAGENADEQGVDGVARVVVRVSAASQPSDDAIPVPVEQRVRRDCPETEHREQIGERLRGVDFHTFLRN